MLERVFEGKSIRIIDEDGNPWFVAKDVCEILGHSNPTVAVEKLELDEKVKLDPKLLLGSRSNQEFWAVNESGLYGLIFSSNKPRAKDFRKWVTSEVLPSIRKTGSYSVPTEIRNKSKAVRNAYTQCLKNHGVNKPHEFIQLTYTHKEKLQIPRTKKKDQYDSEEILLTTAAEMLTQWHVEKKSLNGYKEIKPAAVISANAVFASTIGLEEGSFGKAKQLSSEAA